MTNFDWAKLGVKLIGLWVLISSLRSVPNVVEAVHINRSSMPLPFALAVAALNPLVAGLIGLYLWIRSDRLASSIFPRVSAVESPGTEEPDRLVPLALSLMGVWFVSGSIPTLVYNISLSVISLAPAHQSVFGTSYLPPAMTATAKANIIAALVRALIGFSLLLGAERLAKVISVMRGKQSA
jgi:hypothetical protein